MGRKIFLHLSNIDLSFRNNLPCNPHPDQCRPVRIRIPIRQHSSKFFVGGGGRGGRGHVDKPRSDSPSPLSPSFPFVDRKPPLVNHTTSKYAINKFKYLEFFFFFWKQYFTDRWIPHAKYKKTSFISKRIDANSINSMNLINAAVNQTIVIAMFALPVANLKCTSKKRRFLVPLICGILCNQKLHTHTHTT